ncbi:CNT family concentrative nucleoside transporter [Thermonema lapsum]|uniref:CNT family concentrative nucleoside transporter n=1 Tax=Thermonema lapsum TaxID=28195 RepID=A0A846MNI5_9BACT|nr:nucleoside transporter C-terminal domain-containing protein [Thermonema lapsum]NIK72970.1 CNT family concentrative nucleoside transporter [Thermonema lapsum]
MEYIKGLIGIIVLLALAVPFSKDRKAINWRLVIIGVLLQVFFAFMILRVEWVALMFKAVSEAFVTFLNFSLKGAEFIFGDLAKNSDSMPGTRHSLGFIFAFQVLPTIIFFSTVSAALYYLGILQKIVYGIAWVMKRTMGLSGPESLAAAGNIFLGQTEAPLLVKPFVEKMTMSELMCLMTGGMATIAGGVLGAYVSFLGGDNPADQARFAAHLLSASIMSAPAAIVMAKILYPELEPEKVNQKLEVSKESIGVNLIDAMSNGAADGLKLALNVGGMLLAFIAVIALLNAALGQVGAWLGINDAIAQSTHQLFPGLSLEYLLGQIGRPLAFLMGVDWNESLLVGSLIGQKTAINEFVAYVELAAVKDKLSERALLIATYALCGFSNFSSIAIQIGGIGGMAPARQSDLSRLGMRALLGASLACFMTATIAGAIAG